MQKVFIRGVKGRGAEVIAKLESLGGRNDYGLGGDYDDTIYIINHNGTIVPRFCEDKDTLALMWAGTEIFLDEPIEEPKPINTLKEYDPVMVSNNGEAWTICLCQDDCVYLNFEKGNEDIPLEWTYVVPLADFDFSDYESNRERSIVK